MKIVVNLLPFRKELAGAGKYAQKIFNELTKIDEENDYFIFVSKEGKQNFETNNHNFHFVLLGFNPNSVLIRIIWEQLIFPFKLKKLKPDSIFTPSVAVPLLYKGRYLTTIHDIAYKKIKKKYTFIRRMYINLITLIAAKKSNYIFTVSEFSKAEIENEFSVEPSKIIVTYNGVDEIFFSDYSEENQIDFRNKYGLPKKYILYVGAIEPGKNIDKLFDAFSIVLRKFENELYLVMTAGVGWKQESLINKLDILKIKDKVIFLPYIEEAHMPLLYKCSKVLTYLSSYEGFGMPILEAMAAGVPIVTSESMAIKEFAGNAVNSVDPNNINEIALQIINVLKTTDQINFKVKEGRNIAKGFHWYNSAKIIHQFLTIK